MDTPPAPQPEGVLLESAREDAGLSVRESARRAGISEGWWRQVVKGATSMSGGAYAAVSNVPAKTIAKMATAVGLTPERMETEGRRPDAAERMRRQQAPAAPSVQPPAGAAPPAASPLLALVATALEDELARSETEVWAETGLDPGRYADYTGPVPGVTFTHPAEAALMGMELTELGRRVRWIAEFRVVRARPSRAAPESRRAG